MDFKDFINQIKELTDPAIFAIIAKFAIAFYFLKLLFKGFKELLKLIFALKEKKDNFEESQIEFKEFKKTLNKVQEAGVETMLRISKIEKDLSFLDAYRDEKHGKDTEVEESRKTMKLVLEKLTTINKF
jgi:predicted nuclease with TOPRIM domain